MEKREEEQEIQEENETVRMGVAEREDEKSEGNCKGEKRRKQDKIREGKEMREENKEDCNVDRMNVTEREEEKE